VREREKVKVGRDGANVDTKNDDGMAVELQASVSSESKARANSNSSVREPFNVGVMEQQLGGFLDDR
jgi:hypothetical protein